MKYYVICTNVFTGVVLEEYEFATEAEALEYAIKMNVTMHATPLLYQLAP